MNGLIATIGYTASFTFGILHSIFKDIYTITIRLTFTTLALIAHIKSISLFAAPLLGSTNNCLILPTQIAFSFILLIPLLDIIVSIGHAPSF